MLQFLFESVFLSIIGGLIGLLLVLILSIVLKFLINFAFPLTFENIITGIIIATVTGILAGIVPALQASKLDPVEAMRKCMSFFSNMYVKSIYKKLDFQILFLYVCKLSSVILEFVHL